MQKLIEYLRSLPPGVIKETAELEKLLSLYWEDFEGNENEGMAHYKLHDRMEEARWEPPLLKFVIERHGATVCGSSRAELQGWAINIEEKTASCGDTGRRRQLYKTSPRLDVTPLAEGICRQIISHERDEALKWNDDGSVRILIGKVIPGENTKKQTLEGRRRRFRAKVETLLTEKGWKKVRLNVFAPVGQEVIKHK